MTDFSALRFDVEDGIARITLHRPDAGNAINVDVARDLMHAALRCQEDPAIRAAVLTGAGKAFCVGGDLRDFAGRGDAISGHLKEVTTYLHAGISRLVRLEAPLVAAVNGAAAGAGFSLALFADYTLAADTAKFTMAYTRAGLTPDGSSSWFLPRVVGLKRALDLTLTNRVLSAAEAETWGIVNRVVAPDRLDDETHAIAAELAAGATRALGAAKRLMYGAFTESLETQMEDETEAIARMARTADGQEGMAAFLEKRRPSFRGA